MSDGQVYTILIINSNYHVQWSISDKKNVIKLLDLIQIVIAMVIYYYVLLKHIACVEVVFIPNCITVYLLNVSG